jgi:hypothetical protein
MVNAIQIAIIGLLFRPLETILPQERWVSREGGDTTLIED